MNTHPASVRWTWDLAVLPLLILGCLHAISLPLSENDTFLHILMGRDILSEWRLTGDPAWTYGPDNSGWVTFVHWPSQVLMALGYEAAGFGFFTALHVVLMGAFLLSLFAALSAVGVTSAASSSVSEARAQAAILVFSLLSVGAFLTPRANAFSAIFSVLLGYWVLSIIRTGWFGMRWWLVPLAVWGWVLLHGSAMLGVLLLFPAVACWWVIQPNKQSRSTLLRLLRLAGVVLLAALTPALSPLGLQAWGTGLATREASQGWIVEWSSLSTFSPEGAFLAFILVWAVAVGIRVLRRHSGQRAQAMAALVVIFAVLIPAMVLQQRNYLLFLPTTIVLLSWVTGLTLGPGNPQSWERNPWATSRNAVMALGLGIVVALAAIGVTQSKIDEDKFPVAIAQRLAEGPEKTPRRIIAPIGVASQIPFYAPGNQVAFDARLDRYPREILIRASDMLYVGDPEWQEWIEEAFPGTTDLLVPKSSPLVRQAQDGGWRITDETARWVLISRPS